MLWALEQLIVLAFTVLWLRRVVFVFVCFLFVCFILLRVGSLNRGAFNKTLGGRGGTEFVAVIVSGGSNRLEAGIDIAVQFSKLQFMTQ